MELFWQSLNIISLLIGFLLLIIIVLGFSLFLNYILTNEELSTRILNTLFCHLAIAEMIHSILYFWGLTEFVVGLPLDILTLQLGMFVGLGSYLTYTLISFAVILKRHFPDFYLKFSLTYNWKVSIPIKIVLVSACQVSLNIYCHDIECARSKFPLLLAPLAIVIFIIQSWIILDWAFNKRHTIMKWMRTNLRRLVQRSNVNAVAPFEDNSQYPQEISIAVVNLQDWNQLNYQQVTTEVISSITTAITFLIIILNLVIGVSFGFANTVIIRFLMVLSRNALTVTMWIFSSQQLYDHGLKTLRKMSTRQGPEQEQT